MDYHQAMNISANLSTSLLTHLPLMAADLFLSPGIASAGANSPPTTASLLYNDQGIGLNYPFEVGGNGTAASSLASSSLHSGLPGNTAQYRQLERLVEVSLTYRTMVGAIYIITALVAFIVNFFALLILFFGRRKSRQLNRFLSNLGFSDIIFAIFNIPFTYITLIYNTWWLPDFLCPLTGFVQVLAPTVAFYTLIAIGVGRYVVIVTGHESPLLTKAGYTKAVIISIWVLAVLVASPTLIVGKISPVMFENETYSECTEDWSIFAVDSFDLGKSYTVGVFTITFILPVIALTFLYGRIGIIIYKHQQPVGKDIRVINQNLTQTKIKVVKMLLLLVISFIICWSPSQVFYLLLWLFQDIRTDTSSEEGANEGTTTYYRTFYYTIYFIFHWLSVLHTIINPFIYCFCCNNFQKSDLIDILQCRIQTGPRSRKSLQFPSSANFMNRDNSLKDNRRSSMQRRPAANDSIVTLKFAPPPSRQFDV